MKSQGPSKRVSVLMVVAYAVLPLLLLFTTLGVNLPAGTVAQPYPLYAYLAAGLVLLMGAGYGLTQIRPDLTPQRLQTACLVSMGLTEICVLIGFVTKGTAPVAAFAPFAVASSVAPLVIVLPRVLTYWRGR